MKILKIVLSVVVILIAVLTIVYAYYGGFSTVRINTEEQGGEIFVYTDVTGDYSNTGTYSNEVYYTLLNDYNIETYKGCGIYLDNPKDVDTDKLRSEVGCIVEFKDSTKIEQVKEKYKVKILPKGKYVVSEFPLKGTPSFIVGIMKVYPALEEYYKNNNITVANPAMEIYDVPNEKIIYRIQIQ